MSDSQIPNPKSQDPNNNQIPNSNDQAKQAAIQDLAKLTEKPTESFEEIAEEFEEEQADYQAAYNAGGDFSKKLEEIAKGYGRKGGVEMEPHSAEALGGKALEEVMEVPTEPELEKRPELAGYIEKVEKAGETQQLVVDDYTQQVLLKPTSDQTAKVTLPLTADQVEKGLHEKVWESIRWLAEWCVRQIKMLAGRAEYKK